MIVPENLEAIGNVDEIGFIGEGSIRSREFLGECLQDDVLMARGWAALPRDPWRCSGLFAVIDDGPPLEAIYGIERLDVATALGDDRFTYTGFRVALSTSQLAPGSHSLRMAFRDGDGFFVPVGECAVFQIKPNRNALLISAESAVDTAGAIDALAIDDRLFLSPVPARPTDTIVVRGWIIDRVNAALVSSAYCVVGGRVFPCVYGFLREDVARAHNDDRYARCGFTVRVPLELVSPGRHVARIRAIGADGESLLQSSTFEVDVAGERLALVPAPGITQTRVAIDSCSIFDAAGRVRAAGSPIELTRGDRLFIRGWALDEMNDALPRGVYLCVDGVTSVPAICGLDRRDVATHFGRPEFATCGFTGILETTLLPIGDYDVRVCIVDKQSTGVFETPARVAFKLRDA